jgi:DNA primase catalytic core
MIPENFKDDLLARVNIVDVIEPYVQLKKAGGRFYGLCPFHEEKTPSFAVHVGKQFYYCFGCGANGDAIGFLMDFDGLKYHQAVKKLAESVGLSIPKDGAPVSRRVIQRRVDAEAMQECMEHELLVCVITTSDYQNSIPVSPEDRQRFIKAVANITAAIEFVKKRRLFDYERRQIVIESRSQERAAA